MSDTGDTDSDACASGIDPEIDCRNGVLRLSRPGTRWLSTGCDGGFSAGPAAYNVTVPDDWPETDLAVYTETRRREAGFDHPGPTLLTGVEQRHARIATAGSVTAVATAGLTNPVALPDTDPTAVDSVDTPHHSDDAYEPGTVNVLVLTDRSLSDGALASLVALVAEAKTATLLSTTGFSGTTTDAIVVGCDPAGEPARFSGSATTVGASTRACVRAAVTASLSAWDADSESDGCPDSVADAEHGMIADETATVFAPDEW